MNPVLNNIFRFLAYSNLWVALSVASLTWLSGFILEYQEWNYILFTFFTTIGFYSYSRFYQGATLIEQSSKITKWQSGKRKSLIITIVISGVLSLYFALAFTLTTWLILVVCGAISIIYPLPYILGKWPGIRHVAGLKLFIIACVWTVITFVIPAINAPGTWDTQTWILTAQRFFIITAITIPFDVRDKEVDHPDINTLPMLLGSKTALFTGVFAIFGVELSIILQYYNHHLYSGLTTIGLLIGLEIMMILIHKSFPVKNDLHYSFWLEGSPIFLAIIVGVFSLF